MDIESQIATVEGKLDSAVKWFETNPDSPLFDKAFDRFRELLRERAELYLEQRPKQLGIDI